MDCATFLCLGVALTYFLFFSLSLCWLLPLCYSMETVAYLNIRVQQEGLDARVLAEDVGVESPSTRYQKDEMFAKGMEPVV